MEQNSTKMCWLSLPLVDSVHLTGWPQSRRKKHWVFQSLSYTFPTRACRSILLCHSILLKSTVLMHQIHLAAYGLLDICCTQSAKSIFSEVAQNCLTIPCSERSPSIPDLWPPCEMDIHWAPGGCQPSHQANQLKTVSLWVQSATTSIHHHHSLLLISPTADILLSDRV